MNNVALVTGAARGIGAQIAIRLAQDGFDIAILDLDRNACVDTADAVRALGRSAIEVSVDITDEKSVEDAVSLAIAHLGTPFLLVNNAGIMRSRMVHKMTFDDWEQVMAVNVRGSFLMCRAVVPFMRKAKRGRIVNLSSTGALGLLGSANYASAKAAVQALTKSLALELGPFNVTVNAVAPGFVVTEMTRTMAEKAGVSIQAMEAEMIKDIPLGRSGRPDDIAHAVSFFADERSSYISGQILYVAGGPKG
ncbi:SDR family oxidoreductase [Luminiphilus sp.]|nr:SDR family oxidoreductase [Luminiphilus sp.]